MLVGPPRLAAVIRINGRYANGEPQPAGFLLDEPLNCLDARLRMKMRRELLLLHRRLAATMVYVTHDQDEALTLGDRVVLLTGGVVQ